MAYPTGITVNFTACVTENGVPKSGLNISCSIQRKRDNLFFNGTDWQADEAWLATTEEREGIYIYPFNQGTYDNSVEEEYLVTFKYEDETYEFMECESYVFVNFAKADVLERVVGLSQENYRLFDMIYQYGKLISAKMRIYPTADDCSNDTNHIAEYEVTATYEGDELRSYKVVKL